MSAPQRARAPDRVADVATTGAPAGAASAPRGYVALRGAGKTFYRGKTSTLALEAVDLDIGEGEFVAIVGPSGCGKSTLLRMVAGLHLPTTGNVSVNGRVVDRPQTELGIVFQSPVLLDWRTALDNVLMQVELRGMDPRAHRDRAVALLTQVGLGDFVDRYPHELSGGMRQRVAIARALIHDAPLLLMDEPFGALDALTREQMRLDRVVVMSPRPGRIERTMDIALARPRGLNARRDPEFIRASDVITDIFLARGVLHRASAITGIPQPGVAA